MHYSRLKLIVQAPLKVKDLTYKFLVYNKATNNLEKLEGRFDEQGFTKWYEIRNLNTVLIYEVYIRGELLQKISAKAYPTKGNWSSFSIKLTTETTKKVTENIKEIYLDDSEVAWYLVKKTETMLNWSKRVFKRPLTSSDWDILKSNNPHITNMANIRLLQPGQVIILSNSTTVKELQQYKKEAKQAQENLEQMMKDPDFDAEFFAQNYEFLYDALVDDEYVALSHSAVPSPDGKGAMIGTTAKNTVDGALIFMGETKKRTLDAYSSLVKQTMTEHNNKTRLANPKHQSQFRQANAQLFRDFENGLAQRMFRWDTGIQTNNLRRHLQRTALVRGSNYKGGMTAYLENMKETGRISKVLKQGGNFMIGVGIGEAGINIYQAARTGDNKQTRRAVIVEPLKLGGSIIGGRAGAIGGAAAAVLIIGVGTGGVGLIVIGAGAVIGGLAGGVIGGTVGEIIGIGADQSIEWMTN
ncbi:MAG: hypothetical protein PBU42_01205 [Acinetobacter haemolyticus]